MAEIKYTKADALHEIMEYMGDNANVVAYCENELALLESKRVKAKARQDAKRAAGDELQGIVAGILTGDPMTRDDILAAVIEATGDDTLTVGKIQSKLNNLVKFDQASKCTVKTDDKKTKTAYTVYCAE
jgi:hypothetical protein